MTRTPSQIGKANRRNGREAERKVRDYLRLWWPEIDYTHPGGPTRQTSDDRGDLGPCVDVDGDHWTIEVKGPRAQPDPGQIARWAGEAHAAAEAAGKGGLWVLIVRRPGCGDVGQWWAWTTAAILFDTAGAINGGAPPKGKWRTLIWSDRAGDLCCVPVRIWTTLVAPEPF